jgi:hypothetical protein
VVIARRNDRLQADSMEAEMNHRHSGTSAAARAGLAVAAGAGLAAGVELIGIKQRAERLAGETTTSS